MGKKKQKLLKQMNMSQFNTIYGPISGPIDIVDSKTATNQTKAHLPVDLKHHGIILQKHSIIQKLYTQSGPNAKSNEFQMHYWMLIFRHTFHDGGFFDIAVPTCYFNYEQFVSTAHVDFEMKDVSDLSAKIEPIHNMITNQILATNFKQQLEAIFGVEFEPLSVDVGTLHRHPGSSHSQRFSGTDLDANTTNHGIVFPLKSGVDKPSFSGILAVDSGECNVAHYEYRVVNGAYDTNDMTYTKGRCLAITLNDTYTPPVLTAIQQFFGVTSVGDPLKTKEDNSLVPAQTIQALNKLITILPDPNIQLVREENVKTRIVTTTYTAGHWVGGKYVPNTPTVPYKLALGTYEYPLQTLRYNYEKHMDFHKLPYDPKELNKLTRAEMEVKLKEVYAYVPPKKEDKAPAKPEGKFIICDILPYTDDELLNLTRDKLVEHHDELDTYYYGKVGNSIDVTEPDASKEEIIGYILELYANIYEEEQDNLKLAQISGFTNHIKGIEDEDYPTLFNYYDGWN